MNEKSLKTLYSGFVALSALVGGGVVGFAAAGMIDVALAMKLFLAFFSLSFVIGLPFVWAWWQKVDEAVREAHKWAWFWGGSIGMMLGIIFATVNIFMGGQLVMAVLSEFGLEAYAFEAGLILTVTLTAYGYIAAWALWWWRHR